MDMFNKKSNQNQLGWLDPYSLSDLNFVMRQKPADNYLRQYI